MSDTPIFDRLALARGYNRMVEPNGMTSKGVGFFARVEKYHNDGAEALSPDPYLDGPIHLIGAQEADEIYIAPPKVTSLVKPGFVSRLVSEKETHKFPVVNLQGLSSGFIPLDGSEFPCVGISGFVEQKKDEGLWGSVRSSKDGLVLEGPAGGQGSQTGFRDLLDGILQDARRELPRNRVDQDDGRPEEIVLAEGQMYQQDIENDPAFADWFLGELKGIAKHAFPHHIATTVESMTGDAGDIKVRLKGVESALPVYSPLFEGDFSEE